MANYSGYGGLLKKNEINSFHRHMGALTNPVMRIYKSGGTGYVAGTSSISEIGTGIYLFNIPSADCNFDGTLILKVTADGGFEWYEWFLVSSLETQVSNLTSTESLIYTQVGLVKAKTDLIGTVAFTTVNPVSDGDTLEVVSGADHTGTRGWTFSYSGYDLTTGGTTARMRILSAYNHQVGTNASTLNVTATITATSSTAGTIATTMTAAQSALLTPSQGTHNYRYQVQIVPPTGDPWVIAQGWVNVSLFHGAVPA